MNEHGNYRIINILAQIFYKENYGPSLYGWYRVLYQPGSVLPGCHFFLKLMFNSLYFIFT